MTPKQRKEEWKLALGESATVHRLDVGDEKLAERLAKAPTWAVDALMHDGFRIDEWRREPNLLKKRPWLDRAFTLWREALELLADGQIAEAVLRSHHAMQWSAGKASSDAATEKTKLAKHAREQQRWATEEQEKIVLELAELKKKWGTDKKAKQVLTDRIARRGEGKSRRAASKQIERAVDAIQKRPKKNGRLGS